MRKLFYIPIVHTPEDHGSHLEMVKRVYISRYGPLKWQEHVKAISEFWQKLSEAFLTWSVDYTKVRVYQDSLPVIYGQEGCPHPPAGGPKGNLFGPPRGRGGGVDGGEDVPLRIVEELANRGNRNYQLLLELAKKGATIMGTEDPKLLIEERARHHLIVNQTDVAAPAYDELVEQRDESIAQRIDSTLKEGEIGLLFIGALHRVVERLPKDIQVHNPFNKSKSTTPA